MTETLQFHNPNRAEKAHITLAETYAEVHTTNAKGKTRTRKVKGYDFADKAVVELLRKGFLVSDGSQLLVHSEVGPPMGLAFAVDEERGVAWLGDWGALRRVDLTSGEMETWDTGHFRGIREVKVDDEGSPWFLADRDDDPPSDSNYRVPSPGRCVVAVLRLLAGKVEVWREIVVDDKVRTTAFILNLSRDRLLVPWPGGYQLLSRQDGAPQKSAELPSMKHWCPKAALSPQGTFLANTAGPNELQLTNLETGTVQNLSGEFEDVMKLCVDDSGLVTLGAGTPNWSFQQLSTEPSENCTLPLGATDYAFLKGRISSSSGTRGFLHDLSGHQLAEFPVCGGLKSTRVEMTEKAVYARTMLGVFQRWPLNHGNSNSVGRNG